MWEVSVPSWDEPANSTTNGKAKKSKKEKNAHKVYKEDLGSKSSADVFQVVSTSLHGEAAAEVKRVIDEAKKKRRRRSSDMPALEEKSPGVKQGSLEILIRFAIKLIHLFDSGNSATLLMTTFT
jgi:hypothetical protein